MFLTFQRLNLNINGRQHLGGFGLIFSSALCFYPSLFNPNSGQKKAVMRRFKACAVAVAVAMAVV
jgi:hypothetical protein